jgi:endonuclease/exonuclease/phosphatase family metal-dependent hydrolase
MRTRWRIGAASVLAILLTSCAAPNRIPGVAVRALVFNIHAGKDAAGADNLERVAALVRDSRADIVLLQEVDNGTRRSGRVDQLSRLRSLTGFHGVFGKAIDYDGGEYGLGILSRWPIEASVMRMLPAPAFADSAARAKYEARGALITKIAAPWGALRVVDTHLDATRNDSARVLQAGGLLVLVNTQRDSGYTVMGGDLNSEPNGPVVKMLAESGWKDLFRSCGSGESFSFPAKDPVKRIDYLLASSDVSCRSASVLESQASDHRPVLFEVIPHRD